MRSLLFKLTLAFVGISLSSIVLVAFFTGRVTANEFSTFMLSRNQEFIVEQLQNYYQARGSWRDVQTEWPLHGPGPMPGGMPLDDTLLTDEQGSVVLANRRYHFGELVRPDDLSRGIALEVDGQIVGYLISNRDNQPRPSAAGTAFLTTINRTLVFVVLGAMAFALVLGVGLTRAITHPLRELTTATRAIANGQFERRVTVHTQDELGELAEAFNQMSDQLARSRDLRRQMTADIAHDLRTPLSIILGHMEALRDGVLPPDVETFSLLHDEALRLNRLVEDLRTLSLAEAGELPLNRRPTSPHDLLTRAIAVQTPRALQHQITVQLEAAPTLPLLNLDADRMARVLNNLLDNALQHTPAGGVITCGIRASAATMTFSIHNPGAGIAPEDLPHIFERFYRADKSRTRSAEAGGSGLGLAIAKSIVEAHGGRIWADSQPNAGATFWVEVPN